jgi:hypothetical protein
MPRLLAGICATILFFFCYILSVNLVYALKSTDYQFVETSLGGVGARNTASTNYQASTSGAILGFGTSADATMQIKAGNETTNDPALSFAIDSPSVSFGSFSPTTTAVATSSFQVSNYTSYGYVVGIYGSTPTNVGGHSITAMSTTATSQTGVEQFGINLVSNSSPSSFGANPNNGQFGYGTAASNYSTANNFRYVNGDTIASAPKSSGLTIYTISYIVNVSSLTPGGQYSTGETIICTGTY